MLEKHGLLLVRLNADAEAAAQYDEKAASAASMTTSEAPRDSDVDVDLLVREAEGVLAAETERVSAEREASEEEEDDDEEKAPIVAAQSSALRRAAVEALTGALTRSLDRSAEAAGLLREELAALRELLSCETKAEEARLGDIEALIVQLGMVIDGKAEIVVRETALLTNIQELKAQTVERVIRDSFDEAAAAKAELISIEMVLSETMVTVKAQLEIERDLAAERLERMQRTASGLPGPGDDMEIAVRQYGFVEIVDLQDMMLRMQQAVAKSDAEVEALKKKVATAMEQRNVLLGLQSKEQLEAAAAASAAASARPGPSQQSSRRSASLSNGGAKRRQPQASAAAPRNRRGPGASRTKRSMKRKKPRGGQGGGAYDSRMTTGGLTGDLVGGVMAVGGVGLNLGKAITRTVSGAGGAGVDALNEALRDGVEALGSFASLAGRVVEGDGGGQEEEKNDK